VLLHLYPLNSRVDGRDGNNGSDGTSITFATLTVQQKAELKGERGDDGYTPVKGINYRDGIDGKDGKTPVKGIDYNDGTNGTNGTNGSDASVTKVNVENVLTGVIATHTHTVLTQQQIEGFI
jgi:hypothetical protein